MEGRRIIGAGPEYFYNAGYAFVKMRGKGPDETRRALELLRSELDTARNCFEFVADAELVEASVHRINALMSQYSWHLRQARKNCGSGDVKKCSDRQSSF